MEPEDDRRGIWRTIRAREDSRKKNIEELRKLMESGDANKNAKSLLKVVIHGEGITANEAAAVLGVRREVVDRWVIDLANKRLIVVDSDTHPNPKLMPSREVLNKLKQYNERKKVEVLGKALITGKDELERKKQELVMEHEARLKLEEDLEKLRAVLSDRENELEDERKKRNELERQITKLEDQTAMEFDEKLGVMRDQLNRERNERVKMEELLRQERDRLLSEERKRLDEHKKKDEELRKREAEIIAREKSIEESEELEILFGEESVDERITAAKEAIERIKKKLDTGKEHLVQIDEKLRAEFEEIFAEEDDVSKILAEEITVLRKRKADLEAMLKDINKGAQTPAEAKPPATPPTPTSRPVTPAQAPARPPAAPERTPAAQQEAPPARTQATQTPPARTPAPQQQARPTTPQPPPPPTRIAAPQARTPTPPAGPPARTPAPPTPPSRTPAPATPQQQARPTTPQPPAAPPAETPAPQPPAKPPAAQPPATPAKPPATQPPQPPEPPKGERPKVATMEEMRAALAEPEKPKPPDKPPEQKEAAYEVPLPPELEEKLKDEQPKIASMEEMRKIFVQEEEKEKDEDLRMGIDIISLVEVLEKKGGSTTVKEAAKELGVKEKTVRKWVATLEEKKLVLTKKHLLGDLGFSLMSDVTAAKAREVCEADRVKDELRRLRSEKKA